MVVIDKTVITAETNKQDEPGAWTVSVAPVTRNAVDKRILYGFNSQKI
jgi:hypothetical protein